MKPWRDLAVWIVAILMAAAFLGSAAALVHFTHAPAASRPLPAAVTIIPIGTVARPTSTPTPTPASSPTAPPPPPPIQGSISIGAIVQVRGTGGDGLRFRVEPGLSAPIVFLGRENETFRVVDGPITKDGYTWWKMSALKSPQRTGWAVSNYLAVLPTPPPKP